MINIEKRIKLIKGDITKVETEAIVNAANTTLLGGGGVDGAIHRAAGPELLKECKELDGCGTGKAKITQGYQLPADYIIHTVGPVWKGGNSEEEKQLTSCYRNSLELAAKKDIKTIAFPAISTGAYRFPIKKAAKIALSEIRDFLDKHQEVEKVVFVLFSDQDYQVYKETYQKLIEDNF